MGTPSNRRPRRRAREGISFRSHDGDTPFGVSRRTVKRLAKQLGRTETEVIHFAIAQLASALLPAYEPDDGALSAKQIDRIKRIEPQGRMWVGEELF